MLEWALLRIDRELNFERDELSEPFSAPYGTTHVALLSMECATAYFRSFRHNEERQEVVDENGRRVRLVFDRHFYDLTPMNMPASRIKAELVDHLFESDIWFRMLTRVSVSKCDCGYWSGRPRLRVVEESDPHESPTRPADVASRFPAAACPGPPRHDLRLRQQPGKSE
jgi:hypothetical protein